MYGERRHKGRRSFEGFGSRMLGWKSGLGVEEVGGGSLGPRGSRVSGGDLGARWERKRLQASVCIISTGEPSSFSAIACSNRSSWIWSAPDGPGNAPLFLYFSSRNFASFCGILDCKRSVEGYS